MKEPNFFIVGAPKCGTTALSVYLGEHPNIFFPKIKEPHYFADELPISLTRPYDQLEEYLRCFANAPDNAISIGEASVWYLYSRSALQNIFNFDNNAKIIVMVRNPIDMFPSLHSQLYHAFYENELDVEHAWKLQSLRKAGNNIPKECLSPQFLQYKNVCSLGFQIKQLFNIFPREQVKIIVFDDFIKSTKKVYSDVLRFLDLKDDGRNSFPPINENKIRRFRYLNYCLTQKTSPLKPIVNMIERMKRMLGVVGFGMLKKMNTKKVKRKPLSFEFSNELSNEFDDDINMLSNYVGKDLNKLWFDNGNNSS